MGRGSGQTFFFKKRHTDGQKVHEKMVDTTNYQGKANQNLDEILPHTNWKGCYQKEQITNTGEHEEKREPSHTAGGNLNWCNYCNCGASPTAQMVKNLPAEQETWVQSLG